MPILYADFNANEVVVILPIVAVFLNTVRELLFGSTAIISGFPSPSISAISKPAVACAVLFGVISTLVSNVIVPGLEPVVVIFLNIFTNIAPLA